VQELLLNGDYAAAAAFLDAHVSAMLGPPEPGFSLSGVRLSPGVPTPEEKIDLNGPTGEL